MPDGMLPVAAHSLRPTSLDDAAKIARAMAASGLFGFKSPEQALSIMLIADAEGMHPAAAARDYHIIEGKPTLKADAMLARFQRAAGTVEWHERNEKVVRATFSHEAGGTLTVEWSIERANGVKNKNGKPITDKLVWKNYPAQMLSARCISEGVRAVFPGVMNGFYAPEEFDTVVGMAPEQAAPQQTAIEQKTDPEPQKVEESQQESEIDLIIKALPNIKTIPDLEGYIAGKTGTIVAAPKPERARVQNEIRKRREQLAAGQPVQDAEFEEKDQPPATEPERDDRKFGTHFMELCDKCTSTESVNALWDKHKDRIFAIDESDPNLYDEISNHWRDRSNALRPSKAEQQDAA